MCRHHPGSQQEPRAQWESSANGGLAWMTTAAGGPWPITTEALRRRRLREGWRKHRPAQPSAGADVGCWAENAGGPGAHGPSTPIFAFQQAPGIDPDDLRDALLQQHRQDWAAARRLLDDAVRGGDHGAFRSIRVLAETLKIFQAGERQGHGLDAAMLDLDAMSLEQLEAVAAGRWPRSPR
jgi:hypothetical protein